MPPPTDSDPDENAEMRNSSDVRPGVMEESSDESEMWEPTEIVKFKQLRTLRLPENSTTSKISGLLYSNSGDRLFALTANAVYFIWEWVRSEYHPTGKASTSFSPNLWRPPSGIMLTDIKAEKPVISFDLSNNACNAISTSGGEVCLFDLVTYKTLATFVEPPAVATCVAFDREDDNLIAVGMHDSTIYIFNAQDNKILCDIQVIPEMENHSKRITGLDFSQASDILISSRADTQICVWKFFGCELQKSSFLQIPPGHKPTADSVTRVQMNRFRTRILAVHETQLAIYEIPELECVTQWVYDEAPISHATFSCNSQLVFATFCDASIAIFNAANFQMQCRIRHNAYLQYYVSGVYPVIVAAHPLEPNQFAVGLSDGIVYVMEPRMNPQGKWDEDHNIPDEIELGSNATVTLTPVQGHQNLYHVKIVPHS